MPHDSKKGCPPNSDDFQLAEEVLARLMPSLVRNTPEYEENRQALAAYRVYVGGDRFSLQYLCRSINETNTRDACALQDRIVLKPTDEALPHHVAKRVAGVDVPLNHDQAVSHIHRGPSYTPFGERG